MNKGLDAYMQAVEKGGTPPLNVLGLFSGIGGFELGLQRAGFNISAYCEIEEKCLRVLRKNFPHAKELKDVKNVDPKGCDVFCGGFPCQDISIA